MFITIICDKDQIELKVDGDYSEVRAKVTNFLLDHNHD